MKRAIISIEMTGDEQIEMSFDEVCEQHDISESDLAHWIEQGLFVGDILHNQSSSFSQCMVQRLQSARRLQADLGVNEPGVVLVLELMEQLQQLRDELKVLTRHRDT